MKVRFFLLSSGFFFCQNPYSDQHSRGDHRSPAEKRSFSDFPQENKPVFALRRHILLCKICGRPRVAPTTAFFDTLSRPHRGLLFPDGSPGTRLHFRQRRKLWSQLRPAEAARLSPGQSDFGSSSPNSLCKKQAPRWGTCFLVARQGLEPWTHALKGRCSTN